MNKITIPYSIRVSVYHVKLFINETMETLSEKTFDTFNEAYEFATWLREAKEVSNKNIDVRISVRSNIRLLEREISIPQTLLT